MPNRVLPNTIVIYTLYTDNKEGKSPISDFSLKSMNYTIMLDKSFTDLQHTMTFYSFCKCRGLN